MGYGYFMEFNQSFFNQSISNLNTRLTAYYKQSDQPTVYVNSCLFLELDKFKFWAATHRRITTAKPLFKIAYN